MGDGAAREQLTQGPAAAASPWSRGDYLEEVSGRKRPQASVSRIKPRGYPACSRAGGVNSEFFRLPWQQAEVTCLVQVFRDDMRSLPLHSFGNPHAGPPEPAHTSVTCRQRAGCVLSPMGRASARAQLPQVTPCSRILV